MDGATYHDGPGTDSPAPLMAGDAAALAGGDGSGRRSLAGLAAAQKRPEAMVSEGSR